MIRTFDEFKRIERKIVKSVRTESLEKSSKLINSYVIDRLETISYRQGSYYAQLVDESNSKIGTIVDTSNAAGHSVSESTVRKLYNKKAIPTFESMAKILAERGRDLNLNLEPFEGSSRFNRWARISVGDNIAYQVSTLLQRLLKNKLVSVSELAILSGVSEATIYCAERQINSPLYAANIVCHEPETVCRIAAACGYRMSILFPRSKGNPIEA